MPNLRAPLNPVGVDGFLVGPDGLDVFGSGGTEVPPATPGSFITFPGTRLGIHLYVAIGQDPNADPDSWIWTEILPNYILWRDKIRVQRGRQANQAQVSPSTMALSLKNAPGRFTWGLGTPIRLDVDPGTGAARRYTGFVVTKNPRADTSGNDRWLTIQAAGVMQRMGRNQQVAHSATWASVKQAFTPDSSGGRGAGVPYLAFWYPLEDGPGALSAAPGIAGNPVMDASNVTFAAGTVPAGISAAPVVTSGRLSALVPAYPEIGRAHV